MRHFSVEELGLNSAEIGPDADPRHGLPLHAYYDPMFFRFELETIFDLAIFLPDRAGGEAR